MINNFTQELPRGRKKNYTPISRNNLEVIQSNSKEYYSMSGSKNFSSKQNTGDQNMFTHAAPSSGEKRAYSHEESRKEDRAFGMPPENIFRCNENSDQISTCT